MAKYRGEGKETKLVDLVNLTHPKATNVHTASALKSLVAGTLKNEDTWESRLSAGEDKATVFKDLLKTNKLGYMALLRNLRNIQETQDKELIALAAERLVDEDAVANSKQLPFRFLSAYNALEAVAPKGVVFEQDNTNTLKKAVERALEISIKHLPVFEGETAILSDNSGSMGGCISGGSPVSALSNTKSCDIANLFATMVWLKAENTYVGLFGDRLISPKLDRSKSLFENFKICTSEASKCGGSTEEGLFVFFEELVRTKRKVNRIMIFSDCQVGRTAQWYGTGDYKTMQSRRADYFGKLYNEYRQINPDVKVYSVDLRGYGNSMVRDGAMCLAGWSEKIFDIMHKYEINGTALVQDIENVVL